MAQEEITGTEISEFPEASTIYGGDVVAGVQSGSNKKFSFATIFAWIKSKLSAAEISYDSETSGSSAENVQDALDDAFSGIGNKQSTITASGILKGDGQGNISAAVAGTDYGTYSKPSGGIPANDMTSAVQTSLGKADTAYQKPSSGIPSSDMASAVQTSLGKADTAYQKPSGGIPASDIASGVIPSRPSDIGAQPTITASGILKGDGAGGVSAATPGTDYQAPLTFDAAPTPNSANPVQSGGVYTDVRTRVPNYGKGVNLLRNWYFVGGGTGQGVFPVNQRGQSSYYGVSYSVDGWYIRNTHALVELTSSGLKLKKNSVNYADWGQYLSQETLNILSGKTVTLSWLDDVDCKSVSFTWTSNSTPVLVYSVGGLNIYAGVNSPNAYNLLFQTTAIEKTFKAVKLELGTEQTLAHQENGTWVLNEIPDYEEELIKCQTSTTDSSDTYANKSFATRQDLTSIQATGTTNTTGAAIPVGAYFYLNGILYQAKTQIDVNATFTVNTNCEQVTVGSILTGTSVSTSAISMPGISVSRIRAGIVFLNIYDFKPSSASGTISGTLPQELRPIQTTSGLVLSADGTKYARISISTQGVVTYTGVDTSRYHYGLISYPGAI